MLEVILKEQLLSSHNIDGFQLRNISVMDSISMLKKNRKS
nr:MAG TPA: hypothetical protein [Caudoviricetes sp.]